MLVLLLILILILALGGGIFVSKFLFLLLLLLLLILAVPRPLLTDPASAEVLVRLHGAQRPCRSVSADVVLGFLSGLAAHRLVVPCRPVMLRVALPGCTRVAQQRHRADLTMLGRLSLALATARAVPLAA